MRNKKLNCKFLISLSYLFIIMISSITLFACSQEPYNFKSEAEKHIINTLATNGFSENEISIQLTNETYSEQINLYTCIAYLEIDSFYSKSIDEMILTYNNLQTNTKFEKDGYTCTKVYCYYTMRYATQITTITEVFVLRKDESGYWKIYGWDSIE